MRKQRNKRKRSKGTIIFLSVWEFRAEVRRLGGEISNNQNLFLCAASHNVLESEPVGILAGKSVGRRGGGFVTT